ncbi:hypothetical protein DICVIV_06135 [Dictyocaulus viviparus]|uniref:Fibronectin type III domain protein n=1 Tax=Dictyocaulus viviparus TaxID=29172 RepID=A0A0D8XVE5_DICVI|nr:hypothetical protein DICVIV_06135 [Dictyocaulus viviparus]
MLITHSVGVIFVFIHFHLVLFTSVFGPSHSTPGEQPSAPNNFTVRSIIDMKNSSTIQISWSSNATKRQWYALEIASDYENKKFIPLFDYLKCCNINYEHYSNRKVVQFRLYAVDHNGKSDGIESDLILLPNYRESYLNLTVLYDADYKLYLTWKIVCMKQFLGFKIFYRTLSYPPKWKVVEVKEYINHAPHFHENFSVSTPQRSLFTAVNRTVTLRNLKPYEMYLIKLMCVESENTTALHSTDFFLLVTAQDLPHEIRWKLKDSPYNIFMQEQCENSYSIKAYYPNESYEVFIGARNHKGLGTEKKLTFTTFIRATSEAYRNASKNSWKKRRQETDQKHHAKSHEHKDSAV